MTQFNYCKATFCRHLLFLALALSFGFTAQAKNKTTLKIGGKLVDKETAQKRIMDYMFGSKKQESEAFMQKVAHQPGVVALGEGVYGKQDRKSVV